MSLSIASATFSKRLFAAAGPSLLTRSFLPRTNLTHYTSFRFTSSTPATMAPASTLRVPNSAIFVCDIQEKFRNAIHEFDKVYVEAYPQ